MILTYDTWGKLISTIGTLASTVGVKNPYTYRGYRYDTETGLYYLQSRYYNPDTCRMLNADNLGGKVGTLLSHNVFVYCMNNPVNNYDPTGHWSWKATLATIAVVAIVAIAVVAMVVTDGAALAAVGELDGIVTGLAELGAGAGVVNEVIQEAEPEIEKTVPELQEVASKGFDSFYKLKKDIGAAGEGNAWHHIVEQTPNNVQKFGAQVIHNVNNIIKLEHGAGSIHAKISGYYSSIQPFTSGQTIRQWLSGQNFQEQYDFGVKIIKLFGGSN